MDRDPLMLSGIQHFAYCRRQWALIHIEQQWAENERTVAGDIMHRRAHDAQQTELRGDKLTMRGVRIRSDAMNITGICDVVEFHRNPEGIELFGYDGKWSVYPVEYKRGEPKLYDADELQLCAQAMCLEEMLLCRIEEGSLFYGETRRRERVVFTDELRQRVKQMFAEIGEDCYIEPPLHANFGCKFVHFGKWVYANYNLTLVDDTHIYVGDDTMFGPNVTIATAGHPIAPELRCRGLQFNMPVRIGRNCWLGAGVIVMPGVTIGDNTVIGAGSVVTKDIPAGVVAVGNPCRILREVGEHDREYYFKDRKINWSEFSDE